MIASVTTIGLGVLCGWAIYKVYKWYADDDDNAAFSDAEPSDYSIIVSIAKRLEELSGGKAYVGLRIPDPETRSLQSIDIVLVNHGKAEVISVKNFSGLIINDDGSWLCMGEAVHPNPVEEVKNQASILESYLEQRGLPAGEECLSYKVVLLNPIECIMSLKPPEVITYEQLMQLKPEHPKLNSILDTARKWDRLWFRDNKLVLGEFVEFKGWKEDIGVLRCIERSDVSCLTFAKPTIASPSIVNVLYYHRNFQELGASACVWKKLTSTSECKKLTVGSNIEVVFQPENSPKVHKFKLSSIASLELSA